MEDIIDILKFCFKEISDKIRNNNSLILGDMTESLNKSGDNCKNLDIIANNIIKNALEKCKSVKNIISEEEDEIIELNKEGKYMVCYDPLDGSSNIDINVGTGTIFSIFDSGNIKSGRNILLAGYCIYSSSTQLVLCENSKVNMYQLIDNEFKLIRENIEVPLRGNIYAINTSYKYQWLEHCYDSNFISELIKKKYNMRWTGSLVLDAHRLLLNGGFFAYPKNNNNSFGKIRLIYEAFPIAYILSCAGGFAITLYDHILKMRFPKDDIHEKIEIRLFSEEEYYQFIGFRDYTYAC